MQKMGIAWILIVLGLIVITLSLLSLIPVSVISIFLLFMLGAGLILDGIYETGEIEGASLGIPLLILGIISIILEIGFIFNFPLMAELAGFIIWIIALFLIITGIVRILSKNGDNRCGVKELIIALLIILVGLFFVTYPWLLGVLIGLWILTTGMRIRHNPNFLNNWN
jgi:membrane protein HdeD